MQKLELTWIGKGNEPAVEPRILLHDASQDYGDPNAENMLIHGDNLLALKALEQEFSGKIKCTYIDPPYNSGYAFEHYEDGLEHSLWLTLMRDRLAILRNLLSEDGVLFISIDDREAAYLIVLLDELFGRCNNCGQLIWEKKKKPSFLDSNMGSITEYILAYAKDRRRAPPFIGGVTTEGKKYPLNNAGNGVRILTFPKNSVRFSCFDQIFPPQDMSEGAIITKLLDVLEIKNGTNTKEFRLEGEWRYSQKKLDEIIANGDAITISKAPFRPNHVKPGGEPKKLKNLLTVAHYGMSTYEDATSESRELFGKNAFDYPKPEKLIYTLLNAVTEPGDLVLDSFLGSGTTAAVAHKMGRRYIGIELGDHCYTHCIPRLKAVVDGEQGGISKTVGWTGGGGFKFYELAPTLIVKDANGLEIISDQYNPTMLAAAVAKLCGYNFTTSEDNPYIHGVSNAGGFIFVTTQYVTVPMLREIAKHFTNTQSLVICASAFQRKMKNDFPNIKLKKIPQTVLSKCEYGADNYNLNVLELPHFDETEEDFEDV